MAGPTGPCYAGLPSYPGCLYGGSNTAQQTTNANAGAGGTAIASGSANANYQGCKYHFVSILRGLEKAFIAVEMTLHYSMVLLQKPTT